MSLVAGKLPGGAGGKRICRQCRRHKRRGFDPWVRKNLLEEEIATHSQLKGDVLHSSVLDRRIPWTEEPGWLQSMGLQRSQT